MREIWNRIRRRAGSYYFTKDLVCDTNPSINITSDNVTIDLCGFTLSGQGEYAETGVFGSGRKNIEIRNGTLRDFKWYGIWGSSNNCENYRVINIRAINNGKSGFYLPGLTNTIYDGGGHLVQNCTVSNNGTDDSNIGIYVGQRSTVQNCTVTKNKGYGIKAEDTSTIKNNTVALNTYTGIDVDKFCTVEKNMVRENEYGGIYSDGNGIIKDNSVTGNRNNYGIYTNNGSIVKDNVVNYTKDDLETAGNQGSGICGRYGSEIVGNTVYQNDGWGIAAYYGSSVRENTVRNNNSIEDDETGGIYCYGQNRIEKNHLVYNYRTSIYVYSSGSTLLSNSIQSARGYSGIYFSSGYNFYKDNVVSGSDYPFDGSVPTGDRDGGGNASY